ncbi:hypothetical protein BC834DRAFT_447330 [Gloeopeniophorella convolvens]|nr:hypothetical protein BC834DRAFT_447330 [Gloeopeniophorella convolvens]
MLDATATPTANGLHYDPATDPDSPLADSPDTPVNIVSDVAVKISDAPEVESDVRHEPFHINLSKLDDDASIRPQIHTPIDPGASFVFCLLLPSLIILSSPAASIPIAPPHGTPPPPPGELLEDVRMAEDAAQPQDEAPAQEDVEMGDEEPDKLTLNGHVDPDEPPATQSPAETPGSVIGDSSTTAVDSVNVRDVSPNEDNAPPRSGQGNSRMPIRRRRTRPSLIHPFHPIKTRARA